MLNKQSIAIIQGMSEINNQAILTWPTSTISNVTKDINGLVHFDKVQDEFPEIGIWDLSSFLSSLSILDDPKISLKDNLITATDGSSEINYVTSSTAILGESVCDPRIITSTLAIDSKVELDITTDLIAKIKKGSSLFKSLKDISFVKDGNRFYVKTTNKEAFQSTKNAYKLDLETTKLEGDDFEITIPISNFLQVPAMDYKMKIHEKNGNYRISMSNAIFEFVLSVMR